MVTGGGIPFLFRAGLSFMEIQKSCCIFFRGVAAGKSNVVAQELPTKRESCTRGAWQAPTHSSHAAMISRKGPICFSRLTYHCCTFFSVIPILMLKIAFQNFVLRLAFRAGFSAPSKLLVGTFLLLRGRFRSSGQRNHISRSDDFFCSAIDTSRCRCEGCRIGSNPAGKPS
jgi:hypothetical protein